MPRQGLRFICLLLLLFGCARGYRKLGWIDSGYKETQLDFSNWLVSYHGGNLDFCKKGAFRRAAELCKEKGFTHFKVKGEQVRSTFVARTGSLFSDNRRSPEYLVENSSGMERKADVAGYSYRVEFLKSEPKSGDAFEAEAVLRSHRLPGDNESMK